MPRRAFRLGQQEIAILEASQRVEPGILRLISGLPGLRVLEQTPRLAAPARLVHGVGVRRSAGHLLKCIPAAIGIRHRLLASGHRRSHLTPRELELAQVAGTDRGVLPAPLLDHHLDPRPHRLHRLGQPAQGSQAGGRLVEQPRLGDGREARREGGPRRGEETRHRPQVRTDRAELERAVVAAGSRAPQDAIDIDIGPRLLVQAGPAAMGHGLVERL
ncbi:MAG TPA: hypothetical protein DD490_28105 [Acidobacteria bacterium]|nr:hypothetical protein [Acidobacteriota bacterium]